MDDCIFCKIVAGKISAQIVHQDKSVLAFRDLNPQAPVHILIIPRKHIDQISSMEEADLPLLGDIYGAVKTIALQEGISETGFRVVANNGPDGGQTVGHLHLHLLGGRLMHWPPG